MRPSSVDPQVLWNAAWALLLLTGAAVYLVALVRTWRRVGVGRGVRWWEAGCAIAGWAAVAAALNPPFDALAQISFAAHMTQHELLILVAAPLVVLGRPLVVILRYLPARWARRLRGPAVRTAWRGVTAPVAAVVLHGVVVWVWHVPALFEAALRSEAVHAVQHATFFWTAAFFWWALVHGRYGRLGYGIGVLFVFVTAVHTSLLGALLTVAPRVWYPSYEQAAAAHGTHALADQQLAGLLMWVPSGTILLICGLALFAAWLGEARRRSPAGPPIDPAQRAALLARSRLR